MGLRELRPGPGLLGGAIIAASVTLLALAGIEWGESGGSLLTRSSLTHPPTVHDASLPSVPSGPDRAHPLGTDDRGRDLLSRLLHGARVSVFVGLAAEAIALSCGLLVGLAAGTSGGRLDALLMRATDVLLALPVPLVAMAAMAVFQRRSIVLVFMVLGLVGWGGIARIVRGEVLSLREREFAEAARALGAGGGRIALRHLLPHALAPALVLATVGIAGNILTEAWLSFLGISTSSQAPTWGRMIFEARLYLDSHPRLSLLPGLALATTAGGFLLLGEGLRRALTPEARQKLWTGA